MRCVVCGRRPRDEMYYTIGDMTVSMCAEHLDDMVLDSSAVIIQPARLVNKVI